MLRFFNTAADVRGGVLLGQTPESLYLDFKKDLNRGEAGGKDEKRKAQMEFCRDLAQFANTFGGALLIGIDEVTLNGVKVAKSIEPLDNFDSRRQWMEQAVVNCLVPSTVRFDIVRIIMPQGLIISVNVPASERLISIWDRNGHTVEYVRRSNHGKAWMDPDEAEALMADTGRRAKLALQRLYEDPMFQGAHNVDLVSGVWQHSPVPGLYTRVPRNCRLKLLGEHEFKLQILHQTPPNYEYDIAIPYGLLREAWRTEGGKIGIFLHVRMIEASGVILEPF